MVSPEQSNASGPVPPNWYGLPIWARAKVITLPATPGGSGPFAPGAQAGLAAAATAWAPPRAYRATQASTSVTYCAEWLKAKIAPGRSLAAPLACRYAAAE